MLDLLLPDVLTFIIREWISSFHELISLDIALTNYSQREKLLLALSSKSSTKGLTYQNVPICYNESKLRNFIAWKDNREILISQLTMKFYCTSVDKFFFKYFSGLVQLTIDQKEAEFDLSSIALGCFPHLEILHMMNLKKISFDTKISLLHPQPLALKELYLYKNKFHSQEILFGLSHGYLYL